MNSSKEVVALQSNIFGAALAFLAGAAVAAAGYGASRRVLEKAPDRYAVAQMLKQFLQILFLVALFLLADRTPWDGVWLLAGGALGLTLPMIWFTYKLVRFNDSLRKKEDTNDG